MSLAARYNVNNCVGEKQIVTYCGKNCPLFKKSEGSSVRTEAAPHVIKAVEGLCVRYAQLTHVMCIGRISHLICENSRALCQNVVELVATGKGLPDQTELFKNKTAETHTTVNLHFG
jgi:hypothetical protein